MAVESGCGSQLCLKFPCLLESLLVPPIRWILLSIAVSIDLYFWVCGVACNFEIARLARVVAADSDEALIGLSRGLLCIIDYYPNGNAVEIAKR